MSIYRYDSCVVEGLIDSMAKLRPARPNESDDLTRLARKAKSHWPYEPAILQRMLEALTICARDVLDGIFFVAEERGRLLGVVGVEDTSHGWALEHLWVDPSAMGRGIGRCLLERVLRECGIKGIETLTFTSDPYAEGFYDRVGAVRMGFRESTVIPGRRLSVFSITTTPTPKLTKIL